MIYPTLDEVKKLTKEFNVIPVTMEVYADMETPISLFKRFEESSKYCFLLESVEGGEKWGRYSFIGRNPYLVVASRGGKTSIQDSSGCISEIMGNPIMILQDILKKYSGMNSAGFPRFSGGAVGFFGYDLVRFYENLPHIPEDDLGLPDSHFMVADELLVFDHYKHKINIIVNLHAGSNIEREYCSATERLKVIQKEIQSSLWKLSDNVKYSQNKFRRQHSYTSNIDKDEFCRIVNKAKQYIKNGDIFQVVLSQRLCAETEEDPFKVYRALRIINPSPYMFYLKFNDYVIVGASPEMLVRVDGDTVECCPIAGTRKRGKSKDDDDALEKELLSDEKELSEHTMLVDLGRNDIGRVSDFGTVNVKNMMHIEKYSHVMHIVSNIQGRLNKNKTAFDALMSVMPAGTLSGAPKVRAMEIIDELENRKRGPYGGAIGYLGFNGNLDSCITIRSIIFKDKKAYIQAGAGIVADSVPENEYEETINKVKALLKAIDEAGEIR